MRVSSYEIGKNIRNDLYVHRDYEYILPSSIKVAKKLLPKEYDYTIVKFNRKDNSFSFMVSPDFDTSPEPMITKSCKVDAGKSVKCVEYKNNPPIYHGKYKFVGKDYKGFDIEESKRREELWKDIPDLDYNRIGRKNYWEKEVLPLL